MPSIGSGSVLIVVSSLVRNIAFVLLDLGVVFLAFDVEEFVLLVVSEAFV